MRDSDGGIERVDLLIVGAGPAGIAAAYHLRHQQMSVLVLESKNEVGGRTKSVRMPGGMANTGAQFVYRDTPSEALVTELGLESIPFEPTSYGISLDGHTAVHGELADVVDGLPLGPRDKECLARFLDDAVAEYKITTSGGSFTPESEELALQTVANRLEDVPDAVRRILETAIRGGAVGNSRELSARYALRYFASYLAKEGQNRLLLVDGMQAIVSGMVDALPDGVVELSTRVSNVSFDTQGDEYVVKATGARSGGRSIRAKSVLLAVPGPLVRRIVPDLPAWKVAALDKARTPGSTTMVVAADVRGVEEYRDWSFVTTVGRNFECVINPTPGRWRSDDEPGIVHFVCYGNTLGYQPDLPGNALKKRQWLDDFLQVAPGLRDRILAHRLSTWEHCFAVLSLQRAAVGPDLQAPVGRMHFAGDWTSPSAGTHGALEEGKRVADAISGHGAV